MSKKVLLSFKENERDIRLFVEVMSQNAKSEFIKMCIQQYLDRADSKAKEDK